MLVSLARVSILEAEDLVNAKSLRDDFETSSEMPISTLHNTPPPLSGTTTSDSGSTSSRPLNYLIERGAQDSLT
jgi:hypothetical protein